MTDTNIADALRQSHDLIAARGHARYRHYEEETGALDAMGSLYFTLPYRADRETARNLIRDAIIELQPTYAKRKNFDLGQWNDESDLPTVLATILHAAHISERTTS